MRKVPLIKGEYYHIFNRGVDKRDVFMNKYDVFRFIQSMEEFNCVDSGNDIFYVNKSKKVGRPTSHKKNKRLVNIICYCLNLNHFHLILEEVSEGGISEFMKRLGGYTKYYNEKYKRSGVLFQGKFKAVHIETNEQLLHTSFYVNLNNKVHKKFDGTKKHFIDSIPNRSSWNEYINKDAKYKLCSGHDIVLGQFKNIEDYKKEAEQTIQGIREKRYEY